MAWRVASAEAWYQTMIERRGRGRAGDAEMSALSW
jgi:hypothetical protein